MTEVHVKFRDYVVTYDKIQTGTVSYARVASWLGRFPHAKVSEKLGQTTIITIDIGEKVPPELRWDG